MFDSLPAAAEFTADAPIEFAPETALPTSGNRLPSPLDHDRTILGWAQRALDISGTTPTLLPDLLRTVSKEAGLLAGDPFNAFDNNPFIAREWLIVSQVLHAAAATMEKRFEALFLGL